MTKKKARKGLLYRLDFPNGKSYIGITRQTPGARIREHRSRVRTGKRILSRAWRKYGEPVITVLAVLESECLEATEVRAIAVFQTFRPGGYNMTQGGEGAAGRIERVITEGGRAKMSAGRKGKRLTDEQRERVSRTQSGRKHSEEHLAKLRGRKRTAEQCARIGATKPGRPILCSNGLRFTKIAEAAKWLKENGFPKASAGGLHTAATSGRRACGFSWSF